MTQPDAGAATKNPWLIFAAVSVGAFMSALDAGIVVVALPSMAQSFGVDVSSAQWALTAYLLGVSVALPLAGRLGDLRSCRQVFLLGLVVFTIASGLCGAATAFWGLAAARVLQSLGAAMLMAVGPALVMKAFPGKERGRALGFNATIVAMGLLAGPGLGGVLLAQYGWSFIFYVNVPVGAVGLVLCWLVLPRERPAGGQKLDVLGAALFAVGMTAFLSGVSHASDWSWEARPMFVSGGAALLCLSGFVFVERRAASPLIDLSVVFRSLFLLPSLAASAAYMASYAVNLLLPFYLQGQLALDPKLMGLLLTASPALIVVVAPISGWLSERIRPSFLSALGLALMGVGLLSQAHLDASCGLARVVAGQVLIGLGFGIFSSPNNNTILSSVPAEKSGLAGGLLALTRNLGMVCGIALATAIFESVNEASGGGETFFPGFKAAFLTAAGLVFLGAVLSLARARMGEENCSRGTVLIIE